MNTLREISCMKVKDIEENLKRVLKKSRYEHVLRVRDKAVELAKLHNQDVMKIELAALLHDCAKNNEEMYLEKYKKEFEELRKLRNNNPDMENPKLLHCYLGRIVAKREYEIKDEMILDAIEFHTTGRVNMTDFEKIIYLADKTEDNRDYDGVDEIRKLSRENLNKAIVKSLDDTIKYLIEDEREISITSVNVRNFLLKGE
ncbi:bis(5'-nucleosyl)-tetraphosphatase (symmetrical) YqeK [uncultured Finegoldia sp.]|uniref:bis(5'-nucleosyl)-tetraphosphatase (symmetrical) YqeK n=1 Tax=uncultured Finegoldia sp. TaxID=328009 RepID=UPI002624FA6E|nr:bis(5'-nucleosyl)-tetraphosphatase (symmetrical) YqeK [uncultured Finegoldia sp.]